MTNYLNYCLLINDVDFKKAIKIKLGRLMYKEIIDSNINDFNNWAMSPYAPKEDIIKQQTDKIKITCKEAYEHTKYYKQFIDNPNSVKTLEEFVKLIPVTTREVADKNINDMILDNRKGPQFNVYTSGSTGKKLVLPRTVHDGFLTLTVGRIFEQMGLDANANYRFVFPKESSTWNTEVGLRMFYPNLRLMTPESLELMLEQKKFNELSKIDGIFTYTRLLAGIANRHEEGIKYLKPKGVIFSGEIMNDETLNVYKNKLPETKLLNTYSSIELGWMTRQCPESRMHIMEDLYFPEVINKRKNDTGEFYCTFLRPLTTLLLRYETGDLVREINDCPCGYSGMGIEVVSRSKDEELSKHLTKNDIMNSIDASSLAKKYLLTEHLGIETKMEGDKTLFNIMIEENQNVNEETKTAIKSEIYNNLRNKEIGGLGGNIYGGLGIWDFIISILPRGTVKGMPGKVKIIYNK